MIDILYYTMVIVLYGCVFFVVFGVLLIFGMSLTERYDRLRNNRRRVERVEIERLATVIGTARTRLVTDLVDTHPPLRPGGPGYGLWIERKHKVNWKKEGF